MISRRDIPLGFAALLLITGCGPKAPLNVPVAPSTRPEGGGVRWVRSANGDEAEAWRVAVGPPLSLASPAPERQGALDSLAVISWNTHVGGGGLQRFIDDLSSGALIGGVPIPHFVLALQEVYRAGSPVPAQAPPGAKFVRRIAETSPEVSRREIEEVARSRGLHLFYVPSVRNGDPSGARAPEDRGNAILSTLPLSGLTALELPRERHRRVAVAATVQGVTSEGEPWSVQVVNLHLSGRSRLGRLLGSFGRGRERQVGFLTEALRDAGPAVLAGDFNTWFRGPGESAMQRAREHFPIPPEPGGRATFEFGPLSRQLDYLLFRVPADWNASYRRLDRRYGSDHYPLVGWVRFESAEKAGLAAGT